MGNKAPLASPRKSGGRVSIVAGGGGGVVLVQEGGEDFAAALASDRDDVVGHCARVRRQRRSERASERGPPVEVCGLVFCFADRARTLTSVVECVAFCFVLKENMRVDYDTLFVVYNSLV